MVRVGMHEAKTNFSKLVEQARNGEDVVVQRNGKTVARIVAVEDEEPPAPTWRSLAGRHAGTGWMSADFDDPIPGFEPYGWS